MNITDRLITQYCQSLKKGKNKKTFFLSSIVICLSGYLFIGLFPQSAAADALSNNNYSIDVGSIDTNPQPTSKPPQQVLGIRSPQPEFTTGPDYTVNTSNDSFSVQLSQNVIDYGILSSTNPVIRNSSISFSDPKFGAEILGYENHPLISLKNNVIENTTCDNGACTPITAAEWNNTLTYGFGYRCDSQNQNTCDPQFSISNYFKQYPEDALNQLPVPILTNYGYGSSTQGTLTYKVNISGTQKTAGYYNSITYLAVPNF